MLTLYFAPHTCALSVLIVLKWLDAPHKVEKVKLGDPAYQKLVPLGMVPAMTDDEGPIMTQAAALLKYLVNKYPQAQLGSDGTLLGNYALDEKLSFLTGDFHPAFWPFFSPKRYTVNSDEESIMAVKTASYARVDRVMLELDRQLDSTPYLLGQHRSIADAYAFTMARWADYFPKTTRHYPNVHRFMQAMQTDEGVQAALQHQA
ncbi:glutathione S-transferase [Mycoavidus sp. HKI]|uniref:glutathione S-transferase family protein n=1 Tax=Mycoavidus sp. HKI TaxID=2840467 RepID=UPI001CBD89E4|nr:glutathione S-transferase [Mycoavidus sp. HKI]UAW64806.1 glutathione S-transferase [Mycoavidus sp. HKI]